MYMFHNCLLPHRWFLIPYVDWKISRSLISLPMLWSLCQIQLACCRSWRSSMFPETSCVLFLIPLVSAGNARRNTILHFFLYTVSTNVTSTNTIFVIQRSRSFLHSRCYTVYSCFRCVKLVNNSGLVWLPCKIYVRHHDNSQVMIVYILKAILVTHATHQGKNCFWFTFLNIKESLSMICGLNHIIYAFRVFWRI